jgi:hypothetical protein
MATPAKPYTFVDATDAEAAEVNADFDALYDWIASDGIHADGTNAFTAIPSGPATNPSSDNQFTRKLYVDTQLAAAALLRAKDGTAAGTQAGVSGTMTHGTHQLLVQGGKDLSATSAIGGIAISFPTAFPNGLLSVMVCDGNTDLSSGGMCGLDGADVDGFTVRWFDDGGVVVDTSNRTTNWIALGW